MDNENLYNSPYVAKRIKQYSKLQKISLKDLLIACKLGPNTFSHMLHGKSLAFDSLAKIADYLDCSVDYLLGRTENPRINKTSKNENAKINIEKIDNQEGGTIQIG